MKRREIIPPEQYSGVLDELNQEIPAEDETYGSDLEAEVTQYSDHGTDSDNNVEENLVHEKDGDTNGNIIKPKVSTIHPPSTDLVRNSLDSHSRPLSPHLSSMQQTANTEDEGHFSSFIEVLHSYNDKFGS
ncbi:hypothetical protein AVEN_259326-1 [Araneus ventricosus]|uniref:Uncharacterized protein n=1 Tax=Araneus ventricosus TaxID=182803 RepID=A0A4Y2JJU0_ARAVE|nr:hypothetical protein AVEN_259326-1 [Araneus ventricosus]